MTILVLGNATVDLCYEVERFPVPGETLLAWNKLVDAGGKGLNQAVAAHRAGVAVRFCAALGNDAAAKVILQHLAAEGLSAAALWRHVGPTDESLIFVASSGENAIVSTVGAARSVTPAAARAALEGLSAGDTLLMQGNLDRLRDKCLDFFRGQAGALGDNHHTRAIEVGKNVDRHLCRTVAAID